MPEEPVPPYTIKDVWAHNVEEEFRAIRKLIVKYPFVAMVSCSAERSFWVISKQSVLLGYRVSRYCCSTIGRIQNDSRISVSVPEAERGFLENHPTGFDIHG
jgi:hypothetical protein